jgi:hypothetical protein
VRFAPDPGRHSFYAARLSAFQSLYRRLNPDSPAFSSA